MNQKQYEDACVKRVADLVGERGAEIETFIIGLVGLAFSEGTKFATQHGAGKFANEALQNRNVTLRSALESMQKDLKSFAHSGISPTRRTVYEWLTLIQVALDPPAKGGD